jgi:hypothetical protein
LALYGSFLGVEEEVLCFGAGVAVLGFDVEEEVFAFDVEVDT